MEKVEIRRWVGETLELILKDEIIASTLGNELKICLFDDYDGIWKSEIHIMKIVNGKWETCNYFRFTKYFSNNWDMITRPWISDMINDITDEVMKYTK